MYMNTPVHIMMSTAGSRPTGSGATAVDGCDRTGGGAWGGGAGGAGGGEGGSEGGGGSARGGTDCVDAR